MRHYWLAGVSKLPRARGVAASPGYASSSSSTTPIEESFNYTNFWDEVLLVWLESGLFF